jgi:hypothetical protein
VAGGIAIDACPIGTDIMNCRAGFNSHHLHRRTNMRAYRLENVDPYLVAFDDPSDQGQTGSGSLAAKGSPHNG